MAEKVLLEKYNERKLGWLHDSLLFIVIIAALLVVFRFVIGISVVGGDSMNPSLYDGTLVVYSRINADYSTGDVISMRTASGEYYIKRVIASGGDTVDIREGKVFVNGEELDEPWAMGETNEETGAVIYPYTVREGNYFVLGDNRAVSMDSRAFGEVSRRQIRGKIILGIGSGGIKRVS